MKLPRRNFLHLAAGSAALPAASRIARAQAYPARPVRIVVGFAPAGLNDINARLIGQWLSERLDQQFIVENRSGAGGNIGTEAVVRSPADGYTLLLAGSNDAINATLYERLNFNFISRHRARRRYRPRTECHGSKSFGSRQDGSRIHRLCQGQSRQDQYGIGRQRDAEPYVRRIVQGDDRRKHGPCAVSWRRAGARGRARWTGAGDVQPIAHVDRNHQGRQTARARGDDRCAPGRCRTFRPSPNSCRVMRRAD
jgi:tripartite tricarboxylate transporter family receptor